MSRHPLDTSVTYPTTPRDPAPEPRMIEKAEVRTVTRKAAAKVPVRYEPYVADPALIEAMNLAIALGRPLLLQGDPGCGKTALAYDVAFDLGVPLEIAYVKSTSRAQDLLYTYDAVQRLYDAQMRNEEAAAKSLKPGSYVRLGPLGRAIARAQHGRRSVVLIDEIDKADLDFPNDLLWELDRLQFRVEEAPEMAYDGSGLPALRPIVIVTHNEEKTLPAPFLRRCIFHYLEFPKSEAQLLEILNRHHLGDEQLNSKAAKLLLKLRELDGLDKKPGLSEFIEWVDYLKTLGHTPEGPKLPGLALLAKSQADQARVRQSFQP